MAERDFLDGRRVTWPSGGVGRGRDANERGRKTSGRGRQEAEDRHERRRANNVQRNKDTEVGLKAGQHHL